MCSCGCVEPHVIARRELATGERIALWSDGDATWGDRFVRTAVALGRPLRAGAPDTADRGAEGIADVAGFIDATEIARAIHLARELESLPGARSCNVAQRRANLLRALELPRA